MSDPTTARDQRRQAVGDGSASDGVERISDRTNPRGSGSRTTPRNTQGATPRQIADDLGIDREGVGSIDRIRGGRDVFLRSAGVEQLGDRIRDDFADESEVVAPGDVDPRVDAQRIAADPRIRDDRRDRVAGRMRDQLAADDEFATADDFDVGVGGLGVERATLSQEGARRRAGRQIEADTALSTVDPGDDLRGTDDGFELASGAQRRLFARDFEADSDVFGRGDLDPDEDITQTDDGFALADRRQRELAADDLDSQIGFISVGPDDLRRTDDGFELDSETRQRVDSRAETRARQRAAREIDGQIDRFDISPEDLERTSDGFDLNTRLQRELAAHEVASEVDGVSWREVFWGDNLVERDGHFELTDSGQSFLAARDFENEFDSFDRAELDADEDITQTDDGFGLSDRRQKELAAPDIDAEIDLIDIGADDLEETEFDPSRRVVERYRDGDIDLSELAENLEDAPETETGFGLTSDAQRRLAAADIDQQVSLDVTPGAVRQTDDGFELTPIAQRVVAADDIASEVDGVSRGNLFRDDNLVERDGRFEVTDSGQSLLAARDLENQLDYFERGNLDRWGDITQTDDGFGLAPDAAAEAAADDIDTQLPGVDVSPGDLDVIDTDDGWEFEFEAEVWR